MPGPAVANGGNNIAVYTALFASGSGCARNRARSEQMRRGHLRKLRRALVLTLCISESVAAT